MGLGTLRQVSICGGTNVLRVSLKPVGKVVPLSKIPWENTLPGAEALAEI